MRKLLLWILTLFLLSSFVSAALSDVTVISYSLENNVTNLANPGVFDGTLGGGASFNASGKIGFGVDEDATSANPTIDTGFDLPNGASWSWSAWYDPASIASFRTFMEEFENNVGGFLFRANDNQADLFISIMGNGSACQTATITDATHEGSGYQMYTMTYNDTNTIWKVYINESVIFTSNACDYEVTTNNLVVGRVPGSDDYNGLVDIVSVFNVTLTPDNISTLFNSGAGIQFPFTAPVVGLNQSLETTFQFLQVGTVKVTGNAFTDILSGNFNITVNNTNSYYAATIPITNINENNTGTCRLLINGSEFDSEFSRTNIDGELGSMYITSNNVTLTTGGYLVQLQCRRSSGGGNFDITGATIDGHLLVNSRGELLNHQYVFVNVTTVPAVFLLMIPTAVNFTTSDLTADGIKNSTIELDWNAEYQFNEEGVISTFLVINITGNQQDCSRYPRSNGFGVSGSIGGDCLKNDAGFNNTYEITGEGIGNGSVIANIHIKEFILNEGEALNNGLNGTNISSSSFVSLSSFIISNNETSSVDIFAKAGIPFTSNSGTTVASFFLQLNGGTVNSSVVSNTVDEGEDIVLITAFLFEDLAIGTFNVSLMGLCVNADCNISGGDLTAYITNTFVEVLTSFSVNATAINNGTVLNVFNVTTSDGTVFSTNNSLLTVDSLLILDNLTVRSPNFFPLTIFNHNVSNNIQVNLSQAFVTFRALRKVTLIPINNFTVNASGLSTTTTNGNATLSFGAGLNQIVSFTNLLGFFNATFIVPNISILSNFTFNFTGVYDARVNFTAVNFSLNQSLRLPVFNISGNITAPAFPSFFETFNSSSEFAVVNLTTGVNYSVFMTATNYTTTHHTNFRTVEVTADRQLVNFTLFRDKSLFIRFRDIVTGDNLTGVSLFLFGGANFNFTVNSEAFLFPFPDDNYNLLATLTGFNSFSSTITIAQGDLINITAFMNNNTQDVSFIVRDLAGAFIEGASIEITRASDGASIGTKVTDIFGAVQFGLNEDIAYNINVTRFGFLPFFGSLNAFQSTYTITLSTADQNQQFFIGLSYTFLPTVSTDIVNNTLFNFSFNISSSSIWNMTTCTFTLLNNTMTGAVLASNTSFCNGTNGFSGNLQINTLISDKIVARATIVLNETNTISIFRFYSVVNSFQGRFTLMTLFDDLKAFTASGFNTASLFFLTIVTIIGITVSLAGSLNVFGEPEKMLFFSTMLVGMASFVELLTVDFTPAAFPEAGQWIVFIVMGLLTIASFLASSNWRLS